MHKINAPSGKFRKFRVPFDTETLEIASVKECEFELIDPDFEDCHASATHVIRELGVLVCGPHSDSARALHAVAIAEAEAEHAAFDERIRQRMFEQKEQNEEKSTEGANPAVTATQTQPPATNPQSTDASGSPAGLLGS